MKRLIVWMGLSLACFMFAACGPPNGKKLNGLNENQSERACKKAENKASSCDDYEIESDCSDYHDEVVSELPDECAATVGDLKSCAESCGDDGNAGCQAIFGCFASGN